MREHNTSSMCTVKTHLLSPEQLSKASLSSLTSTPSPSPTHNYIFSTAITQHPRSDKSSLVMLKNGTMALSREAENRRKALQSIDENDDEDTHFKRYVRCAGFFIVADMSLFIFEFWNLT
mmetsp:Transcript_33174/g.63684  ORF Transcript_33174/g.63684 Transcript_33174/m.63684 type:complete len:120 (+) Transcript_33174:81-440(+)